MKEKPTEMSSGSDPLTLHLLCWGLLRLVLLFLLWNRQIRGFMESWGLTAILVKKAQFGLNFQKFKSCVSFLFWIQV